MKNVENFIRPKCYYVENYVENSTFESKMWKTFECNISNCGKLCGKPSKFMKNVENFIRSKFHYVENYVENFKFESKMWKTFFSKF
jgi:hypothetical protein